MQRAEGATNVAYGSPLSSIIWQEFFPICPGRQRIVFADVPARSQSVLVLQESLTHGLAFLRFALTVLVFPVRAY